ncbi:hypothetical protein CWE12_07255 [Aliidiomarina sedimenti]|uniref:Lipoprotein n=1 Tax=Aliidiomarina sedimenti TaxID=1933879 RepID=A0ABY0BZ04_9GAMM|nr:hypothetical protein [Aliidiomarina sedimenti]RUO29762.1 hypothetical protein CWE12_07255 [Aliidiomarina sedimenti]
MKGNLVLSCILLAVLVGCDSSKTDEEILASGGYVLEYELDGEAYEVRRANAGQFTIACPSGGTCDRDSTYRAHRFSDDSLMMYMSFSPLLVGNYSYASIIQNFNYASMRIDIPSLSSGNSEVYFQPLNPLRELNFDADVFRTSSFQLSLDAFEDGYLSGTWSGTVTELTKKTEDQSDEDCYVGDIMGECYEAIPVTMPFTLRFNIEVEH